MAGRPTSEFSRPHFWYSTIRCVLASHVQVCLCFQAKSYPHNVDDGLSRLSGNRFLRDRQWETRVYICFVPYRETIYFSFTVSPHEFASLWESYWLASGSQTNFAHAHNLMLGTMAYCLLYTKARLPWLSYHYLYGSDQENPGHLLIYLSM